MFQMLNLFYIPPIFLEVAFQEKVNKNQLFHFWAFYKGLQANSCSKCHHASHFTSLSLGALHLKWE